MVRYNNKVIGEKGRTPETVKQKTPELTVKATVAAMLYLLKGGRSKVSYGAESYDSLSQGLAKAWKHGIPYIIPDQVTNQIITVNPPPADSQAVNTEVLRPRGYSNEGEKLDGYELDAYGGNELGKIMEYMVTPQQEPPNLPVWGRAWLRASYEETSDVSRYYSGLIQLRQDAAINAMNLFCRLHNLAGISSGDFVLDGTRLIEYSTDQRIIGLWDGTSKVEEFVFSASDDINIVVRKDDEQFAQVLVKGVPDEYLTKQLNFMIGYAITG
jgi:hypothetical protein